jgi:hypothetical protein
MHPDRRWLRSWVRLLLTGLTLLTLLASSVVERTAASAAPVDFVPPGTRRSAAPDIDFNGDGYADLAVAATGAVQVIYGSQAGLVASGTRRFTRADMTAAPHAEQWSGDGEQLVLATADFDGDGFCDLAIGDYFATGNGAVEAGAVHVLYGSADGLALERSQYLSQSSPGVPGRSEKADVFGAALSAADFGHGPEADLAIGAPGEEVGSAESAGAVTILYGTPTGLGTARSQVLTQGTAGIRGRVGKWDQFGGALAAGNFDGSAHADLAIGVPFDTVGRSPSAGAVNVVYGSESGLLANGSQIFSQATPGVAGSPEGEDFFGYSLAAGHLAGQPYADLVVAIPNKFNVRGAVQVFYGTRNGLSAGGNQLWSYRTFPLLRRASNEGFGETVAIADFGRNEGARAYDDVAVSVRSDVPEDVSGSVFVLYGTTRGLTAAGAQLWSQDVPGVPGVGEDLDWFGETLAAADFGHPDGGIFYADLAVGAPYESLGRAEAAGRVHVLFGSANGLTTNQVQVWKQSMLGGRNRESAIFGGRLSASGP